MRAVVGAVDDDGVVGDAEFVEEIEQLADIAVMVDHRVVVGRLPAAGLTEALRLGVRAKMHVCHVHPDEEGSARLVLALDEIRARPRGLVVDRFHALLGQRPGVLDALLARGPVPVVHLARIFLGGPGMDDAPGKQRRAQQGRFLGGRVIRILRFLLRVQVIQIPEEFVESVGRRQILVQIAEVILAELPGRVAERFEQLGDRRILLLQPHVDTGHPDLAHTGAIDALACDKRSAARGAALLAVGVGEKHPLFGDPVDVRSEVAHQATAITAEVGDSDVVAPDHQNVRLGMRHGHPFMFSPQREPRSQVHSRDLIGPESHVLRGRSTGVAESVTSGFCRHATRARGISPRPRG